MSQNACKRQDLKPTNQADLLGILAVAGTCL